MVGCGKFLKFVLALALLSAGGLYPLGDPAKPQERQHLGASSQMPDYRLLPDEVRAMPAWEILKTFGLEKPLNNEELEILGFGNVLGNAYSVILEYTGPMDAFSLTPPVTGPQILIEEMYPVFERPFWIELLFNEKGHLIGIFPEFETIKYDRVSDREWFYFDLSPYYFDIPKINDTGANQKWARFKTQWMKNRELIDAFIRLNGLNKKKLRSVDRVRTPTSLERDGKKPFLYIEVPKDNTSEEGKVFLKGFKPDEYNETLFKADPEKHQLIISVFPTVYSPYRWKHEDQEYLDAIYFGIPDVFDLPQGSKALLMGPGSGVDLWLTWLRTRAPVFTAGINALEVANARDTARLAGITLWTQTHNNLVSPRGSFVFNAEQFDYLLWNMPSFAADKLPGLLLKRTQYWDRNFHIEDLSRFFNGLPVILKRGGKALLWNHESLAQALEQRGYPYTSFDIVNELALFVVTNESVEDPARADDETRRFTLIESSL